MNRTEQQSFNYIMEANIGFSTGAKAGRKLELPRAPKEEAYTPFMAKVDASRPNASPALAETELLEQQLKDWYAKQGFSIAASTAGFEKLLASVLEEAKTTAERCEKMEWSFPITSYIFYREDAILYLWLRADEYLRQADKQLRFAQYYGSGVKPLSESLKAYR
jgi:hypothetical protein